MKGHPTTFSHTTLSDIGVNTHAQIDTYIAAGESRILVAQVRNQTGTTLTKGTAVYLSGVSGNRPLAVRAQANTDATSSGTFGVVQNDILTNHNGFVVCAGYLEGFDTSGFAEGAVLWLSPTVAGGFTTTKPQAPNHAVYLGVVTRSHTNQGSVEIRIINGYELEELHNVLIVNPLNKQVIAYDSADSLYKNITLGITDISGLQTALNGKENTITAGTTAQYFRGDKTFQTLDKTAVGLPNVDNTSDANKPVSTATQTALNAKQPLTPRVQTVASSATVTPTASDDLVVITAQATGLTLANPTGAFAQGQSIVIRIKDNGTARSIAYGADYRAIGVTQPTTTVINKTTYLSCIYNATDSKLDIVSVCTEA